MIPRWLARWFERPPVIYFPGDTRSTIDSEGWEKRNLGQWGTYETKACSSISDPIGYASPSQAASTLSRHGHAKRRASYREFHDAMAKAAGRPPIVWHK